RLALFLPQFGFSPWGGPVVSAFSPVRTALLLKNCSLCKRMRAGAASATSHMLRPPASFSASLVALPINLCFLDSLPLFLCFPSVFGVTHVLEVGPGYL